MTGKHLFVATTLMAALLISPGAYAGGGMGGGISGGMGGGHGMMGGQGSMMGNGGNYGMGYGQNSSNPWMSQPREYRTDTYKQQERQALIKEIRQKRQELSDLYRSDKPDKSLIDQKIAELNQLETAYDRSASGAK